MRNFEVFKKQALQGLNDNIKEKFPDDLIKQVNILDYTAWLDDDLSSAL